MRTVVDTYMKADEMRRAYRSIHQRFQKTKITKEVKDHSVSSKVKVVKPYTILHPYSSQMREKDKQHIAHLRECLHKKDSLLLHTFTTHHPKNPDLSKTYLVDYLYMKDKHEEFLKGTSELYEWKNIIEVATIFETHYIPPKDRTYVSIETFTGSQEEIDIIRAKEKESQLKKEIRKTWKERIKSGFSLKQSLDLKDEWIDYYKKVCKFTNDQKRIKMRERRNGIKHEKLKDPHFDTTEKIVHAWAAVLGSEKLKNHQDRVLLATQKQYNDIVWNDEHNELKIIQKDLLKFEKSKLEVFEKFESKVEKVAENVAIKELAKDSLIPSVEESNLRKILKLPSTENEEESKESIDPKKSTEKERKRRRKEKRKARVEADRLTNASLEKKGIHYTKDVVIKIDSVPKRKDSYTVKHELNKAARKMVMKAESFSNQEIVNKTFKQ